MARPIMVPLDGSQLAEQALRHATSLARQRGAALLLVRVVDTSQPAPVSIAWAALHELLLDGERDAAADYLQACAERVALETPGVRVETLLRQGDPVLELIEVEGERDPQLVVLTTHGRTGIARWLRGSVAERMVRHGAVPLLLIRPQEASVLPPPAPPDEGWRVLVPLDGSALAEQALPEACALAAGDGGQLLLLRVVAETALEQEAVREAQGYLEGVARSLEEEHPWGLRVRCQVIGADDPAAAIVSQSAAGPLDVVALCTHGRGGLGRWLYGSTADRVAQSAAVPVLLWRPAAVRATAAPAGRDGSVVSPMWRTHGTRTVRPALREGTR